LIRMRSCPVWIRHPPAMLGEPEGFSYGQKESTQNPKISGVILELLGGFEPPTSSLPKANYIIRKDMRHNFRAYNQQETIPLCQSTEALV